jgi:dipeptidyl aminopeptidase/acylaminoacyl peptidase
MVPMLRGENGNPGDHEMFFGEVVDAIAAGRYAASLPYVDPRNVFVAGHSSGGTEAILAALLPSPFAASTPIGGYVDMEDLLAHIRNDRPVPFDESDVREVRLRSARHFAPSLQCPVFFLCGSGDATARHGLDDFVSDARRAGKECQAILLPGDHGSSKPAALRKSAELFKARVK